MIESGYIKWKKGSCLQADLRYEMRYIDEDNIDEIMNLQEIVIHHLADKEIFRTHSADYFQEHLHIGYNHVCCMVSPKKRPRLQNILSQGLIIKALKFKFQWRLRYIMHKNLLNPYLIGQEVVRMDSKDIPGQINLLNRGFHGFHLSNLSDGFEIHYAKPI